MSGVPEDVQRFIAANIDSAEQLEVLLLLHRRPDRGWRAHDVSREIFTVPAAATLRLESLVELGFLRSDGAADPEYRYGPRSEELGADVQALADAYRADRVEVLNLVFRRPPDPLRSFSDAFRIR
jgi:DNA-binding IclR family transcriptional regulator